MASLYRSIEGWFDFDDVYELAISRCGSRPARFVEIGAYKGRSTCYMAERIRELGLDVKFEVVDTFAGDEHIGTVDSWPDFAENLTRAGLLSSIIVHRCLSLAAADDFTDGSLDFVFIDATHTYDAVSRDIAAWWPKVKPGGLLAGHDYIHFPGVRAAVNDFVARHDRGSAFRSSRNSWMLDA
jgi:predicted O-methyltransferase YrrM